MAETDLLAAASAALQARQIVAADPRKLKPGELVRLLNSTPLGPVTDARRLAAHREQAGLRIGEGKTVDLFRYAAWLFDRFRSREAAKDAKHEGSSAAAAGEAGPLRAFAPSRDPAGVTDQAESYSRKKERERERNAAASESGRDIGELPAVADAGRKASAIASFRLFCETYFPDRFGLAWSADHLKVLARIEATVCDGGLFALAMPRGSGKTTICEAACLWAAVTGRRKFLVLIGASAAHAIEMLDALKTELETNDLLAADFPEVCMPIRALEGLANRAKGQLYKGERTHIGWVGAQIILPAIAGSQASGAIVRVAGITGRIRGLKFVRPSDGLPVRPDLVIIDDPQTDQSARSPTQCENRRRVLAGAILGLAGPGQKIAGIMPCTVVQRGDLADEFLDRDLHPEWQGERMKLVYKWPTNTELWETYETIRASEFRAGGDGRQATGFYRKHRDEMDEGAEVAWPSRHNVDELSALQHAFNLRIADPAAFAAEYQNEPEAEVSDDDAGPTAEAIAERTNGFPRGEVPRGCTHLTAFIDVQKKLLYWLVVAWRDDFTGYVLDYGAWPDPGRAYFTLREIKRSLQTVTGAATLEGAIFAALQSLAGELLTREFRGEGGDVARIEKLLIDANWGESTDTVYGFCRQSPQAALLMPSHGRPIGASNLPMSQWQKKLGDRLGFHWMSPATKGKRSVRHVSIDTNFWKSFLRNRLSVSPADRGALTLFDPAPKPGRVEHRLLSEHLTSETAVRVSGRNRTLDEWKLKPNKPDNHWLDCLVGSAAAASMLGCALIGEPSPMGFREKKPRLKFSELQKQRGNRG